ncbi:MAG: hypothetical protein HFI36_03485 [Bacilli bacterium]|jgi:cell division protein FtsI/penicillin-binding protein 2|nr:hypothetical protein [Bacilli bacterium]
MNKKFYGIISALIIIFSVFMYRTVSLAFPLHDYYLEKYYDISEVYVKGDSAPRGRILDINGEVLVDNIGINTILYHKSSSISLKDEIDIAKKLAVITNYSFNYHEKDLINYYLILYPEISESLITSEERKLYSERKLSKEDLFTKQKERITKEMLDKLSLEEKYSSYFYYLMNDGYTYDNKAILTEIDESLYAKILEANIPGIFGEISWTRQYLYGDTLKSILGHVSSNLPKEKSYLLEDGYSYNDKVGISGLEEYYEEYLKGNKAIYKVEDGLLKLEKAPEKGNDLVLEIDINIQVKVDEIIKEQILKAKKEPNTEFYRESYALISEPKTGAIKAIGGIRLLDNGEFQDVSINVIKNSYTVGSAVKAASLTVGYQNQAIDIGTTMTDGCVKLANIPAKCSYRRLGSLNDIRALALSSNYYQFIIALKVAGYDYRYNMEAPVTIEDFNKYRTTFASYGLGTTTGIDLPGESPGLLGSKIAPDLLMNLAIGQYDLYTPTSLLQYINTLANNGSRLKLNLMHSITNKDNVILNNTPEELNKVELDEKYMNRIKTGLREVVKSGTGYWYVKESAEAAGKTGTSESYIDSDYDGNLDSFVLSNTFLMYAPAKAPKYSLVVISPNTSNLSSKSKYRSPVNRLIARNINDFLFSSP